MKDIVQEARGLIDGIGAGECGPVGPFVDSITNLLERIHELESQLNLSELARLGLLESLGQFRQALDWGEENRVLGFELVQELEQERDAALEQMRVLKEAARGVQCSFENFVALGFETREPKPEAAWNEYDHMMIPKWRVLEEATNA